MVSHVYMFIFVVPYTPTCSLSLKCFFLSFCSQRTMLLWDSMPLYCWQWLSLCPLEQILPVPHLQPLCLTHVRASSRLATATISVSVPEGFHQVRDDHSVPVRQAANARHPAFSTRSRTETMTWCVMWMERGCMLSLTSSRESCLMALQIQRPKVTTQDGLKLKTL